MLISNYQCHNIERVHLLITILQGELLLHMVIFKRPHLSWTHYCPSVTKLGSDTKMSCPKIQGKNTQFFFFFFKGIINVIIIELNISRINKVYPILGVLRKQVNRPRVKTSTTNLLLNMMIRRIIELNYFAIKSYTER